MFTVIFRDKHGRIEPESSALWAEEAVRVEESVDESKDIFLKKLGYLDGILESRST